MLHSKSQEIEKGVSVRPVHGTLEWFRRRVTKKRQRVIGREVRSKGGNGGVPWVLTMRNRVRGLGQIGVFHKREIPSCGGGKNVIKRKRVWLVQD